MRSVISGYFPCLSATFTTTINRISNSNKEKIKKQKLESLSGHGLFCAAPTLTSPGFPQVNLDLSRQLHFLFQIPVPVGPFIFKSQYVCMKLVHHAKSGFRKFSVITLYSFFPPFPFWRKKKLCILKITQIRLLNGLLSLSLIVSHSFSHKK